jgi:hypothetical protein
MQMGATNSTRMLSTSIMRGSGIPLAWRIAKGQLRILSKALNGNKITKQRRNTVGA